jgi:hypothetical protein
VTRTCRDAIIDAFVRLERRHGRRDFQLAEIVTETLAENPKLMESTVRTHVTSRMCVDAPDHHGTTYSDLTRVGGDVTGGDSDVARRSFWDLCGHFNRIVSDAWLSKSLHLF